jgi:hypothetical protein
MGKTPEGKRMVSTFPKQWLGREGRNEKAQPIAGAATDLQGCEGVQEFSSLSIRTDPFQKERDCALVPLLECGKKGEACP